MNFWNRFPGEEYFKASLGSQKPTVENVNAHVHTPYSFSAFNSINHALELAKEEDVKVVGINDFYSTKGYKEWAENCANHKVFPLFNIEFVGLSNHEQKNKIRINDPNNPGRIYISGKGLSFPVNLNEPYYSQLERVKQSSNNQVKEMCDALNKHLESAGVDIQLSYDEILEHLTMGLIRERHLAKALRIKVFEKAEEESEIISTFNKIFQKGDLSSDVRDFAALENEIRGKLLKAGGPAFIPESPEQFLNLEEIRQIILKSGGIPTYPLLADSVNGGFTEFEQNKEELLETLKEKGFYSVEFITNRNTTKVLEDYASFFNENGFLVSFGSEHNTPELIPLELKTVENEKLTDKLKEINYSNACILAVHQFLMAKKGQGYLDESDKPMVGKTDEFKKLGAQLLEYYYTN